MACVAARPGIEDGVTDRAVPVGIDLPYRIRPETRCPNRMGWLGVADEGYRAQQKGAKQQSQTTP